MEPNFSQRSWKTVRYAVGMFVTVTMAVASTHYGERIRSVNLRCSGGYLFLRECRDSISELQGISV